jgi:hypothetical protein
MVNRQPIGRWLPAPVLTLTLCMIVGVMVSTFLINEKRESAVELIHQQLWADSTAQTTQLPTWRVTGTLNPVIGGVEQVVGVPSISAISPSASAPSPPSAAASQTAKIGGAAVGEPAVVSSPWVPPPKPWEPLGNFFDDTVICSSSRFYLEQLRGM